jgi:hypothetical protein
VAICPLSLGFAIEVAERVDWKQLLVLLRLLSGKLDIVGFGVGGFLLPHLGNDLGWIGRVKLVKTGTKVVDDIGVGFGEVFYLLMVPALAPGFRALTSSNLAYVVEDPGVGRALDVWLFFSRGVFLGLGRRADLADLRRRGDGGIGKLSGEVQGDAAIFAVVMFGIKEVSLVIAAAEEVVAVLLSRIEWSDCREQVN